MHSAGGRDERVVPGVDGVDGVAAVGAFVVGVAAVAEDVCRAAVGHGDMDFGAGVAGDLDGEYERRSESVPRGAYGPAVGVERRLGVVEAIGGDRADPYAREAWRDGLEAGEVVVEPVGDRAEEGVIE